MFAVTRPHFTSGILIKLCIGGIAWRSGGICRCTRAATRPSALPDKRCNKCSQYIFNTHVAHCHYFRDDLQSKRCKDKYNFNMNAFKGG